MATISDYLTSINDSKNKIKTAIKNKKVAIDDTTPLADYAGKIDGIKAEDSVSASALAAMIQRDVTSITIPDSITSIGNNAFEEWYGLTNVTIPNSVTSIGERAFYSCGLTTITIPNSVKAIKNYTFVACNKLTNVTIPNSITSIGYGAFNGCIRLTSITIPNSVTSIQDYAFNNCTSLTSITINKPKDSITGAPWKAPSTCTIVWNG
jgi:hypothetical protein